MRLAVFVGALVGLTVLVSSLVSWERTRELTREHIRERLWADAAGRVEWIAAFAAAKRENIALIASGVRLRELVRRRAAGEVEEELFRVATTRILRGNQEATDDLRALWVTDRSGRVITSTDPLRIGQDLHADRSFACGREGACISLPTVTDARQTATVAAPVRSNGEGFGVAMAELDIERLAHQLAPVRQTYETLELRLGSLRDGRVVYHFRRDPGSASPLGVPPDRAPVMKAALEGRAGSMRALEPDGREVLAVHLPVPGEGWGLVARVDALDAFAPVRQMRNVHLVIGGMTLLMAMVLSMIAARVVSRPLASLAHAARALGGGDLEVRASERGGSELRELAFAFNGMADSLQRHRDHLDELVRSRTEALEQEIAVRAEAERRARAGERRFRAVAESANDAIISADHEGKITYFNPSASRLFGWEQSEAVGQPLTVLMPPRFHEAHRAGLRRVVETGVTRLIGHTIELEGLRRDGTEFPVELSLARWRDPHGNEAFSGLLRDISERRKVEAERGRVTEALSLAKEAAEEANQAKSQFLANMSHELRTPMNGIIGMADLLLTLPLSPQQRDYVDTIRSSADTLLELLNDVLDFSRIEAGKLRPERVVFSLRELLEETLASLAVQASDKGLELVYDIAPDLPAAVIGDPGRLRQVVLNLAGNALKFTREGEIVVRLRPEETDGDRLVLRCDVSDTGPGIAPEDRARIFRAFEQVDTSLKRTHGGTGLGLAIASELVRLMGGRLSLESEVGEGSTFSFTVELGIAATEPVSPPEMGRLRGLRLLVVDDNETNRTVLMGLLAAWGLATVGASSGSEALAVLREQGLAEDPISVVLLDAHMPGMDGMEVARRIREDPQIASLPVVLLSSAGDLPDPARAAELGIQRSLVKPAKHSDLLRAIAAATGETGLARPAEPGPKTSSPPRRLRVLIAEDDPVNQKVAVSLLEARGHEVRLAQNGEEAMEALRDASYDVVLMDVRMPRMDGLAATAAIREREAREGGHVQIVAMTAHAMAGDRQRCLDAGMDDYVSKPVHARDLYAAVERAAGAPPPPATVPEAPGGSEPEPRHS